MYKEALGIFPAGQILPGVAGIPGRHEIAHLKDQRNLCAGPWPGLLVVRGNFSNPPKRKICSAEDDQERYPAWVLLAIDVHDRGSLGSSGTFASFALPTLQQGLAPLFGVRTAHPVVSLRKEVNCC